MKDKTCSICGGSIGDKADYYLIQSYLAGTFKGKIYTHKDCFDGITKIRTQAARIMEKIAA